MNRCLISLLPIPDDSRYESKSLKKLHRSLTDLATLPYEQVEQIRISQRQVDKISVQGVQPKFSARLKIAKQSFEIVDTFGTFIIKPQNPQWPEMPENEAFTMLCSSHYGLETPNSGLVQCSDQSYSYFIQRFDRYSKNKKLACEDFAQLADLDRDHKYRFSMEKIVVIIEDFCTFPAKEKVILLRRVLFNFIFGNEDMHLKNYSLITDRKGIVKLSPCYDLLNTAAIYRSIGTPMNEIEEIALSLAGKKRKLKLKNFQDYAARLGIDLSRFDKEITILEKTLNFALEQLDHSFMSEDLRDCYQEVLKARWLTFNKS